MTGKLTFSQRLTFVIAFSIAGLFWVMPATSAKPVKPYTVTCAKARDTRVNYFV